MHVLLALVPHYCMQIESLVSSSKQLQTAIIRLLCIHGRMEISLSSVLLISSEWAAVAIFVSVLSPVSCLVKSRPTSLLPFLFWHQPRPVFSLHGSGDWGKTTWDLSLDSREKRWDKAEQQPPVEPSTAHPVDTRGDGRGLTIFKFHYLYVSEIVMQI